ncbi:YlqD family protein [Rubeoparvulum massiliense]|uniref:YlqD family protein n=1 Tax=Rubeoparvulum massiliense TaxID=1631346 RepID=UPI00065E0B0F|nr:YlqD family protein [Rubeoparvulum massiliense]
MKIRRPIIVKTILTEKSKSDLLHKMDDELRQLQIEMEQLQFERRKLLAMAEKKGQDAIQYVQEKMDREMAKRETAQEEQTMRRQALLELPIDSEIVIDHTETEVEVRIGHRWSQLITPIEIIIRDDIVVDIRGE